MNESFWKRVREAVHGPDREHAHRIEDGVIARAVDGTVSPELRRELASLERDPARAMRLGRFAEGALAGDDLLVNVRDGLAHQHVLGASGSGKSYFVLHELISLLRRGAVNSLVVLDMKGELAELLVDQALPALAASLPAREADALLNRIVVVDPFSTTHPPPLNVLVRDPGLPLAIQARDVAECFEAATETTVSARMETILDWLLRLGIETGTSFLGVRRALQEPAVLDGLVRLAADQDTIRYFVLRFATEPKASKLALMARLDRFLALPMTQLALGAKGCLDFDRLLDDRITIVNLGRAPAGLQSVARFFAMVVLTRFVRAIFRRPPQARGFASLLVADEWQVALNTALAQEFEAILTLARSRGVHLWLANQQLAQLDRHGATLRSVLLGQVAVQAVFRLAHEDAQTLKRLFPITGTVRRHTQQGHATSAFLTPAEELEARIAAAGRLPNREGYWFDRRKPWGAIPFRSATLTLPPSSALPAAFVARAQRGVITSTVADFARMRDDEDARLDQLAAGPGAAAKASPIQTPTPPPAPPASPRVAGPHVPPTAPVASAATPPLPHPPGRRRGRPKNGGGLPPIR